jgi:hypothetical protein
MGGQRGWCQDCIQRVQSGTRQFYGDPCATDVMFLSDRAGGGVP